MLTSFALCGNAAVGSLLGYDATASGPDIWDAACAADFTTADHLSWTIGDNALVMRLSPLVPAILRRAVRNVVERLLAPYSLEVRAVAHCLVHAGRPSFLEAVQPGLELSEEQRGLSWQVLREQGNCSSATVSCSWTSCSTPAVPSEASQE